MDMTQPKALFDLLYSVIIGIIGMAGVLYGGYSIWDGFTNDQPESKKKGITIKAFGQAAVSEKEK